MPKMVVGIFDNRDNAEMAARQIKEQGLRTDDISIVARQDDGAADAGDGRNVYRAGTGDKPQFINDNISGGIVTGGVLGGLAGLLAGTGSLFVPGLGVIAAAGPITGLLSGAVTGGIVGGLIDLGIPENRSRKYEGEIRRGKILLSMGTDDDKVDSVVSILRNNGSISIDVY